MPKKSPKFYKEAQKHLVGGVNSPLRAFKPVGGNPLFIIEGKGSKVRDSEGKEYIDYVQSYGALILGHAHPKVVSAVKPVISSGSSFATNILAEAELAKEIKKAFPSLELIRFTNSGTEAAAGAMKLAKAYTKRSKILKLKEGYHGWTEQPYLEADFNDLDSVRKFVSNEVAAIILEPIAGNNGVIPPKPGFLEGLRQICDQNGSLLIFDEVITGFRVAYGGAQELYGVNPDLTCLGKIIGGGFPIGAFGGKKEIMSLLAPEGPVYQAGTFSGNPVSIIAGLTTLKILKNNQKKIYAELEEKTKALVSSLRLEFIQVGSMFSFQIGDFAKFFWKMLKKGIYFAPSDKEANFVSLAHHWEDIEKTIKAARA